MCCAMARSATKRLSGRWPLAFGSEWPSGCGPGRAEVDGAVEELQCDAFI